MATSSPNAKGFDYSVLPLRPCNPHVKLSRYPHTAAGRAHRGRSKDPREHSNSHDLKRVAPGGEIESAANQRKPWAMACGTGMPVTSGTTRNPN